MRSFWNKVIARPEIVGELKQGKTGALEKFLLETEKTGGVAAQHASFNLNSYDDFVPVMRWLNKNVNRYGLGKGLPYAAHVACVKTLLNYVALQRFLPGLNGEKRAEIFKLLQTHNSLSLTLDSEFTPKLKDLLGGENQLATFFENSSTHYRNRLFPLCKTVEGKAAEDLKESGVENACDVLGEAVLNSVFFSSVSLSLKHPSRRPSI